MQDGTSVASEEGAPQRVGLLQSLFSGDRGALEQAQRRIAALDQQLEVYDAWCQAVDHHAAFGMWVRDVGGHFVFVNRAFEAMCGLPREKLIDQRPQDIFSEERARGFRHADEKVVQHGVLHRIVPCDATGEMRTFEETRFPIRSRKGALLGIGCFLRELTEHTLAEQALEQAQRIAQIGSWRWSARQGCLLSCSEQYARIVGLPVDRIISLSDDELMQSSVERSDIERLKAVYRWATATECRYEVGYQVRQPDGNLRPVLEIGEPVRNAAGEVIEFCGTVQDMSELKSVEAALRRSRDELDMRVEERTADLRAEVLAAKQSERALVADRLAAESTAAAARAAASEARAVSDARSELLAQLSADIRTPVGSIAASLAHLRTADLPAEQRSLIETAQAASRTLESVARSLLDIARLDLGRLELVSGEIEPLALIEGVADALEPDIEAKGLVLACYVDPALPRVVKGDGVRLRQVLQTLAGDLIRRAEQGTVVLSAELVRLLDGRAEIEIRVVCNGATPAVPGELQPGVSLDMTVACRLLRVMGGAFQNGCDAGNPGGLHVTIELPVVAAAGDAPAAGLKKLLSGHKALIIEADAVLRAFAERTLRSLGLAVLPAASAAEAALILESEAPAIAVLGRGADGNDAPALAGELRKAAGLQVPLLLELPRGSAGSDGFDGTIERPLRRAAFERALATVLPGLRPRTQAPVRAIPPAGGLNLLLIEDDAANQRVAAAYLKRAGHRVEIASDGLIGIGMLQKFPYDAVLMDVQLPRLDGLHATRMIRTSEGRNDVPIIALTANAMKGDAEVCLAVGMDAYFPKPVDWDRLLALLSLIATGEHRRGKRIQRTA